MNNFKDICLTLLFSLFAFTNLLQGQSDSLLNKADKTMTNKTNFIVTYTKGTVRNSQTIVLGEIVADSASNAIKHFAKGLAKNWKIHEDTKNQYYAKLENPISFVSDAIDFYSAAKGGFIKKNGKYEFEVVLVKNPSSQNEERFSKNVWAINAEEALKIGASPKDTAWNLEEYSRSLYHARMVYPNVQNDFNERKYYEANIVSELKDQDN